MPASEGAAEELEAAESNTGPAEDSSELAGEEAEQHSAPEKTE
jgi:hypothetical protein